MKQATLFGTSGMKVRLSLRNEGDLGLIPGLGRSPGEGHGNPLHYSSLENYMDRGAWQAACSPWGCRDLNTTEQLTLSLFTGLWSVWLSLKQICFFFFLDTDSNYNFQPP